MTGTSAHAVAGWRVAHTVSYENDTDLVAVVPLGTSDAWAFGAKDAAFQTGPLAVHWNGRGWSEVPLPAAIPGEEPGMVTAADGSAPGNVWAAGDRDGQDPYALRWDGAAWTVAKTWPGEGQITGLTAFSPTDVWVFGASGANVGLGTWHFDGHDWTRIDPGFEPAAASAVSPDDMWAVGRSTSGDSRSLGHYDGSHWNLVDLGDLLPPDINTDTLQQNAYFTDATAVASDDVWVAGYLDRTENAAFTRTVFLLHWNGHAWRKLNGPDVKDWTPRRGMDFDGRGGLWIPGSVIPSGDLPATPLLMHVSATGTWSATNIVGGRGRLPFVDDIALLPGTRSALSVGALSTIDQSAADGAIYAYGAAPADDQLRQRPRPGSAIDDGDGR
ncbi:MAG TPA: hypothetical protein VF069_27685 [Streptosporangiaceae bacterium]